MKNEMKKGENNLIKWARDLHSISKNGLLYTKNSYDHERYNKISNIASEMYANISNYEPSMVKEQIHKLENKEVQQLCQSKMKKL